MKKLLKKINWIKSFQIYLYFVIIEASWGIYTFFQSWDYSGRRFSVLMEQIGDKGLSAFSNISLFFGIISIILQIIGLILIFLIFIKKFKRYLLIVPSYHILFQLIWFLLLPLFLMYGLPYSPFGIIRYEMILNRLWDFDILFFLIQVILSLNVLTRLNKEKNLKK